MDKEKFLDIVEEMVRAHFQECSEFTGERYLADTDHATIDDFMEELECWLIAAE